MRIDMLIFDGAEDLDFVPPREILARGCQAAGQQEISIRLVTPSPQHQITTAHGMTVLTDGCIDETCNVLIISGGGWVANDGRGVRALATNKPLLEKLRTMHKNGVVMVGICTGAMLLAHAGILTNRRATTHYAAQNALAEFGAVLTRARVVDDGNVITCGAVTASLDTAFWLVERFWGSSVADTTARVIDYQPSPDIAKPLANSRTVHA